MSLFKKRQPEVPPDLAALRSREQQLVASREALESEHLETTDIERSQRLLDEINDLNAQIGALRDKIDEFPT